MKRRDFIAIAGAAACVPARPAYPRSASLQSGFEPLFNGEDLSGWTIVGSRPEAWTAKDGVLTVEEGDGWLRTEREYKNFVLRLEFLLPPGGNSGVFLRAPRLGDSAYAGLEIQILDHFHERYKDIKPRQFCGSVYDLVAAKQEGLKPAGEWNRYEITHDGDDIKVVLNGVTIIDTDLSEITGRIGDHPGLGRTQGYIGLQAHGSRVDFRNIEIKETD